jgi:hypothetical protein
VTPRLSAPLTAGCLTAALALALALAACGGDKLPAPAKPPAEPAPSASAVEILAPDQGATVRGRAARAGTISAPVTVSGHADSLQVVRVDGRCAAATCTKFAYTGAQGRWTARLRLVVPPRTRHWTVTADYAVSPAAATGATLTLAVRATKVRARPRARRKAPEHEAEGATTQTQPPASPATPTTPTPAPTPAPSSGSGGTLVLVGDSLAVGVRSLLPAALPTWKMEVLARVGRPLAEGMSVLSGLDLSHPGQPTVLAISLFTNDDPSHVSALEAAVRRTIALVGSRGCAIWATIARPPVNGVSYRAANALLARLATDNPRLRLVPWAERVAATPQLLAGDGVHASPAGYQLRAQLYAQAAQACG